jgi:hypothetical protein
MQLLESIIKIQMINITFSIFFKVKCHSELRDGEDGLIRSFPVF